MEYHFRIHDLLKVQDGDSLIALIDLGFATYTLKTVRMAGIDTPELNSGTALEKQTGRYVKAQVIRWLDERMANGLILVSEKWEGAGDKYGRVLGDVITNGKAEKGVPELLAQPVESLRAFLLNNKLARVYSGEKKTEWSVAALNAALSKSAIKLHGK
jgi:endonuclease YncB( thermonuclease family)